MTRAGFPLRNARPVPLPGPAGLSRAPRRAALRPSGLTAEAERLVCRRAGYLCEACGGRWGAACVRVVRFNTRGVPEKVWTGPANGVLLCERCVRLARAGDPLMRSRGFLVDDADPRFMPMVAATGNSLGVFWRTADGHRVTSPPQGTEWRADFGPGWAVPPARPGTRRHGRPQRPAARGQV